MSVWSSNIIHTSGARDHEFDSLQHPKKYLFSGSSWVGRSGLALKTVPIGKENVSGRVSLIV